MDYNLVTGGVPGNFYTADHEVTITIDNTVVRKALRYLTNAQRVSLGYYPTQLGARPDERYYNVGAPISNFNSGTQHVDVTFPGTLRSDEQLKQIRRAELAAIRFGKESLDLDFNGSLVTAGRGTLEAVRRLKTSLTDGLISTVDFKLRSGDLPVTLNLAAIVTLDDVLFIYEQGCRTTEAELAKAVEMAEGEDILEVDFTEGWPDPSDPLIAMGRANMISLVQRRASMLEAGGFFEEAQALKLRHEVT